MKTFIVEYEAFNVGRHSYQHTTVPVRACSADEARKTVESWAPGRVHVLSVGEGES